MVFAHGARSTLGLVIGTVLLPGCQALLLTAPWQSSPDVRQSTPVVSPLVARKLELQQAPSGVTRNAFAELNLTEEQKRQLEAIPAESPSDPSAEYQRLLLAPQVDTAALKALLTPTEEAINASINPLVAIRNILAPQQRQQLVRRMKQDPPTRGETLGQRQIPDAMIQRLELTPEQETALKTMNKALDAHHRTTQLQMVSATEAFMNTGDVTALRQASIEHARVMPIDAMVAYYASLTQAQRRLLLGQQQGEPPATG